MDNTVNTSKRVSRKAMLQGAKAKAQADIISPSLMSTNKVSASMDILDQMNQANIAQREAQSQVTAPHVAQVTAELFEANYVELSKVRTLAELVTMVDATDHLIMATVPLNLIKGSAKNHRDFHLPFAKFIELAPKMPEGWEKLDHAQYVEDNWGGIFAGLYASGELSSVEIEEEKEVVAGLFGTCQSFARVGIQSEPECCIVFDQLSYNPLNLSIIFGERRIRAAYLMGLETIKVKLDHDASERSPSTTIVHKRENSRVVENAQKRSLSVHEKLKGYVEWFATFQDLHGVDAVVKMNNVEIIEELRSSVGELSYQGGSRYMRILRHTKCDLLIKLNRRFVKKIVALYDVANESTELAKVLKQPISDCHVYAASVMQKDSTMALADVPVNVLDEVKTIVLNFGEATHEEPSYVAPIPNKSGQEATKELESASNYAVTPEPTVVTGQPPALTSTPAPISTPAYSDTVRVVTTKAVSKGLQGFGVSANKGVRNHESHCNLLALMIAAFTLLDGGTLSEENNTRFSRLNMLKGDPATFEDFKNELFGMLNAKKDQFGAMTSSSVKTQELLDSMKNNENNVGVIQKFTKSSEVPQ